MLSFLGFQIHLSRDSSVYTSIRLIYLYRGDIYRSPRLTGFDFQLHFHVASAQPISIDLCCLSSARCRWPPATGLFSFGKLGRFRDQPVLAGWFSWVVGKFRQQKTLLPFGEQGPHKSLSTSVLGGTCPLSLRVAKASLDSIHDSRALCAPGITGQCRDHRPAGRTRSPGIELMESDWRHRVSGCVLLTGSLSLDLHSGQLLIYYFDRKIYIKKS